MNTLAKLVVTLCIPVMAMCSTAQTQTHVQVQNHGVFAPEFTRAELDQMLAPIALYPDTVLSHILIAATYPLEVVHAERWARENSHLEAEVAVDAVDHKNWDPSVKALVAFPQILQRMSEDLDWTQRLGDAFLADEVAVMEVIQDLRQKAYASGNLRKMKHVNVHREKRIIIIEPAVERVVYIPYYDTRVVYGNWWWPDYPPTYWHHPRDHIYVSGFYWGPRAFLGASFFTTSFHWHQHRVVYIDRRHHHHRPNLYSSRKIARYEGAHHWQHNPVHRRGVSYRSERVREHYGSQRTSFSKRHEQREFNRREVEADRSSRFSRNEVTRLEDQRKHSPLLREQKRHDRAEEVRARLNKNEALPKREWHNRDAAKAERSIDSKRQIAERRERPVDQREGRFERKSSDDVAARLAKAREPAEHNRTEMLNKRTRTDVGEREMQRQEPVSRTESNQQQRRSTLDVRREQRQEQRQEQQQKARPFRAEPEQRQRHAPAPREEVREAAPQRRERTDSAFDKRQRLEQPRMHKTQKEEGGSRFRDRQERH